MVDDTIRWSILVLTYLVGGQEPNSFWLMLLVSVVNLHFHLPHSISRVNLRFQLPHSGFGYKVKSPKYKSLNYIIPPSSCNSTFRMKELLEVVLVALDSNCMGWTYNSSLGLCLKLCFEDSVWSSNMNLERMWSRYASQKC